ncbi:MAG TPA: histidine phosphatase family protein [Actinomycetota bacterium]
MRALEIRRHAKRQPDVDRLSARGRAQAQEVGRTLAGGYAVVYVSPAERAAETVAWFLRGLGEQLPPQGVVPGLAGRGTDDSPRELGAVLRDLLHRVPEGERGLAVGHTPLIEKAVLGLTGREIAPLAECEGVLLSEEDAHLVIEELRLP